jgi:hypothetical protein
MDGRSAEAPKAKADGGGRSAGSLANHPEPKAKGDCEPKAKGDCHPGSFSAPSSSHSWSSVSDDPSVVEAFAAAGAADMDAGLELAELLRLPGCSAWLGPLRRLCLPESHPEFGSSAGRIADNPRVFKVPTFSDRHHGWDGDDATQYASITVAFASFLARTLNAVRVARSLLHTLACLYPRVDQHLRIRRTHQAAKEPDGPPLHPDPLTPMLQLAEALHALAKPLDATSMAGFRSNGTTTDTERHAEIWAAVAGNAQHIVAWWSSQLREGAYPPAEACVPAESEPACVPAESDPACPMLPFSYVPAAARINGWVAAALAGRLSCYTGAEPAGQAAASWSLLALLSSALMAETSRMMAGLGAIMGTYIACVPRFRERDRARASWRIAWDASMAFFKQPENVASPVGLSQYVGMGKLAADDPAAPARVRFPVLNGQLSKALGIKIEFARLVRDAFFQRLGHPDQPAAWPREPLIADEALTHKTAAVVPLHPVDEKDAWEYSIYSVMMISLASVGLRSRRRALIYLPPFRWDTLIISRSFLAHPSAVEAPVDVATAPFCWEVTRVMSRQSAREAGGSGAAAKARERSKCARSDSDQEADDDDEESERVVRHGYAGGAIHVSAHTAELVRPVSFAYVLSSRRARKAARAFAPEVAAHGRLHAQIRSVVANPCAWGPLGSLL